MKPANLLTLLLLKISVNQPISMILQEKLKLFLQYMLFYQPLSSEIETSENPGSILYFPQALFSAQDG